MILNMIAAYEGFPIMTMIKRDDNDYDRESRKPSQVVVELLLHPLSHAVQRMHR